ncbi:GLPGLI family protein [Puia dinghuensis]|uniref:GLPGLI family protein n=1 Tax=Puia dinghuensis TaxID=1792502 RepID=A0A8J2XRS0_9BACT|nr:GLPGLI family protein [Puia dinghuensis]GGB03710.1 GLPGLI family protein [Puia dinghuensis]
MKKAAALLPSSIRVLLPLLCLTLALASPAQPRQGSIVYEKKLDVYRHMPKDDQNRAMIPQFQTTVYELLFKDSISVYKAMPKDEAPDPFDNNSGGMHVIFRMTGPGDDGAFYRNYSSGRLLEETILADKKYIITDTIPQQPWKLSDDTTTILNHLCKKATLTTPRGEKVVAWYTSDIPLPIGPDQFSGLPGAILQANIDEGSILISAKEIRSNVDNRELKAPSGGHLISRADYRKKRDEVFGPPDAQGRRIDRN